MSVLTTLAATVLMSPANVAADLPAVQMEIPGYNWDTQKVMACEKASRFDPTTHYSVNGTMSTPVGGTGPCLDDMKTWD